MNQSLSRDCSFGWLLNRLVALKRPQLTVNLSQKVAQTGSVREGGTVDISLALMSKVQHYMLHPHEGITVVNKFSKHHLSYSKTKVSSFQLHFLSQLSIYTFRSLL